MMATSDNLRAAGLLVLTVVLFGFSDTISKFLFGRLPVGELLFLRGILIVGIIGTILVWTGRIAALRQALCPVVFWRGILELFVAYTFFASIKLMPLADATAILFGSPLVTTAVGALFLGERVGWRRWSAVLIGFAGVLMVAQPTGEGSTLGAICGVLSAIGVAIRDMLTRRLLGGQDSFAVAALTATMVMLSGACTLPFAWVTPDPGEIGLIGVCAVLIAGAYIGIVEAFRRGDLSFLAPFRYVAIPLTILLGWLVFGDVPTPAAAVGVVIIVSSSLFVFYREQQLARAVSGPELEALRK